MIIGIDMGHTIEGANYGAIGILKESIETRSLGNKVINGLRHLGHTVINCTVDKAQTNNGSLNERVAKANVQKLDLFVSLHFNASNAQGHGTEIFTYAAKELIQAMRILDNICSLGFTNRGIKDGSKFAVIRGTKCPSMLIETCFIDNKDDVAIYKNSIDKIARAIAEGIVGQKIQYNIIAANKNSPIASIMMTIIKLLQGIVGLKKDGIATEELASRLPEFVGGESRGSATILQDILIIKGFLSGGGNQRPPIGDSCKSAINRFKKSVEITVGSKLTDKQTWMKLLEY